MVLRDFDVKKVVTGSKLFMMSMVAGGILVFYQSIFACSLDFIGSPVRDGADTYVTQIDTTFQPHVSPECAVVQTSWSLDEQEIFSGDGLQEFSYNFQDAGDHELCCRIKTVEGDTFQKTRTIHLEETFKINLKPSTGCSIHAAIGPRGTGIHCGPREGETLCSEVYPQNVLVSMKCQPLPGYVNTGWTVNDKPVGDPFPESRSEILLNWEGNSTSELDTCDPLSSSCYTITIKKEGAGNGRVVGTGIDCGDVCVARYAEGTHLKLQAIADRRSEFLQWRVDGRGDIGSVLHLATDATLTAVFTERPNRTPIFAEEPVPQYRRFYHHPVHTQDPDGDMVTYRLIDAPEQMSISPSGEITWLPERDQIGEHVIVIEADDGRGGVARQTLRLTITEQTFSHAEINFLEAFNLDQGKSVKDPSLLDLGVEGAEWYESTLLPQTLQGEELLLSFPEAPHFFYALTMRKVVFRPLPNQEVARLENIAYGSVNASQIADVHFAVSESGFSVDEHDTVLLKTDAGRVFKIGNFTYNSDPQKLWVGFDYMELFPGTTADEYL